MLLREKRIYSFELLQYCKKYILAKAILKVVNQAQK